MKMTRYRIPATLLLIACSWSTSFAIAPCATIQILATSDIHGRFVPFDYAINQIADAGSLAQISTAVTQERKGYEGNTVVVDVGDFAQDNFQYLFVNKDNPIIAAMNFIGYDIITLGNHEFNQGIPALTNMMAQFNQPNRVLCGNVYTPQGTRLYALSTVVTTANEVTIGFIGVCTPNITRWDSEHLEGYQVTDPVTETRVAINELRPKVDVLIALAHMGEENEYGTPNSGVRDLAAGCPELDLIICGHAHQNIADHYFYDGVIYSGDDATDAIREQGTLIVMPYRWAAVLSKITIQLSKKNGKYTITNKAHDIQATNLLMKTDAGTIVADNLF